MRGFQSIVASVVVAVGAFVGFSAYTSTNTQASDCSTNSVVKCGVTSVAQAKDKYSRNENGIKNIYDGMGMTAPVLNSQTVKSGVVNKDGTVVVDGKVVATGAKTAGRHNISGSIRRVHNGTTYYERAPSVSFSQSQLSAFVFMDSEGRFLGAILKTCGNPVKATNKVVPPSPEWSCDSLTATKLADNQYKYTVKASVKNGAKIEGYGFNYGDGSSIYVSPTTGSHTKIHTYSQPGTYTVKVTPHYKLPNGKVVQESSPACITKVTVPKNVEPVYSCDSLKADKISRTKFAFTTNVTAKDGATVKNYSYDFGDGKTVSDGTKSLEHTYDNPGSYTVVVTPNFVVNGKTIAKSSDACKVTVTVEEAPAEPVYTCDSLKADKISRTKFAFTTEATAKDGASVKNYVYNFGDSTTSTVTSKTTDHTYAAAGSYTVVVTPTFMVNGKEVAKTSDACKVTVEVEKEPVYTCDSFKADKISRTKFAFTTTVTAKDGASVKNYAYNFGDGKSSTSNDASVEHTYDAPGTYTVVVTPTFVVNGTEVAKTSEACKVDVTVVPEETVEVCDLTTNTIVRVTVSQSQNDRYTSDLTQCEDVKVCDLTNYTIVTVSKPASKDDRYTTDLTQCDDVTVCDLDTNMIVKVKKSEATKDNYTTDLTQCDNVDVCDITTGEIITIKKSQRENANYDDADSDKCKEVETPEKPVVESIATELPKTGLADALSGVVGLGAMTAAGYYYLASRRN